MQGLPKEICWPDNRNKKENMQRTRKLVQKKKFMRKILKSTKIFGEEKYYWRRLAMEGLEIKKLPTTERANVQSGYEIDPCWENFEKYREPQRQG